MVIFMTVKSHLANLKQSATLVINEISKTMFRAGKDIVYPFGLILLLIFGYLNFKRSKSEHLH